MTVMVLPSRLTAEVSRLLAAVEDVRAAGATCDPRVLTALAKAQGTLEALVLREVAAVQDVGAAQEAGYACVGGLLQDATGCSSREATATVRLAERLHTDLAPVGALLMDAQLTRRHCESVLFGLRGLDAEQVRQVLPSVCQAATVLDPTLLARVLREHAEAISPELAEQLRRRLEERTGLSLEEGLDGSGQLRGLTDAADRAVLEAYLSAKTNSERTADDHRSLPRRRLDALIELARHGLDCTALPVPTQGGGRAHLTILANTGTVLGLPGATPASVAGSCHGLLTRPELLRLLCDANLSTLHLTGSGQLESLALGRTVRTVSRGQWKVLQARDRHCVIRGCHQPPHASQAHHVQHWANGGPTDLHNLVLLCHRHHHEIHDQHCTLEHRDGRAFGPDGWTDPRSLPWTRPRPRPRTRPRP